jgi:hypothetical protein
MGGSIEEWVASFERFQTNPIPLLVKVTKYSSFDKTIADIARGDKIRGFVFTTF